MRKRVIHYVVTVTVLVAFVAIGCSKEEFRGNSEAFDQITENLPSNFVRIEQVFDLARRNCITSKSISINDVAINTILNSDGDTLLYVVNYGKDCGWQIISSDMRTPAIIAEGETGSFTLDDDGHGIQVWMDMIAADMSIIRKASDAELTFSEEEISANRASWIPTITRVQDDPILPNPGGQYVVTTTSETIILDTLEHMTPHWDQDSPYNLCCPFKSDGSGDRAPVGCVAVAGAEVLYYLHSIFSVPTDMCSTGSCVGDIDNYTRCFDNWTSSAWNAMSFQYNPTSAYAEAVLLGYVGCVVGMHYYNDFSFAIPAHLRTQLFDGFGISSTGGTFNYDANIVKSNLANNLPVIITASNFLIPGDGDIHCFVIDGYKITYQKYTHYHYWYAYPDPNSWQPPYYTYSYSSPEITSVKINWGWASQWYDNPLNDGWYSLTANWYVQNEGYYNYNQNVCMTYGFSI